MVCNMATEALLAKSLRLLEAHPEGGYLPAKLQALVELLDSPFHDLAAFEGPVEPLCSGVARPFGFFVVQRRPTAVPNPPRAKEARRIRP